jgi:hypothetical protein
MAGYWLKLYTEILDDSKYFKLSDSAKVGMYELLLVAKRFGGNGELPDLEELAFQTRKPEGWWPPVIQELLAIHFLTGAEGSLVIRKFAERQAFVPSSERSRQYRARKHRNEFGQGDDNQTERDQAGTDRDGDRLTEQIETEEETETEAEQKEADLEPVSSAPVFVDPKTSAARMLAAREVSDRLIPSLISLHAPEKLVDYCHAYDQAILEKRTKNPGWLVNAIQNDWDIRTILQRKKDKDRGTDRANYRLEES